MATKKYTGKQVFEIICYVIAGLLALWGLTYIALGMVAQYSPVTTDPNPIVVANATIRTTFGLDMFGWGLIILGIGAVIAVIVLCAYAKTHDRAYEKSQRRALRRQGLENAQTADDVIDAEVEDKE